MDLRLRVRGWLEIRTPLHVGGIARDPAEALPVAIDGQGRVYVPGTGLAGAFRGWMGGVPDAEDPLRELWGFSPEPGDGSSSEGNAHAETDDLDDGQASRVVVRDAVIATSTRTDADGLPTDPLAPASLPVRHGVGIDRVTGAAATEFLYARTVVPPGHYLRLELDIETTAEHRDRDRARLHALLSALSSEQIRLGGARGRGLGVVRLLDSPLTVHEHDFTGPAGLLALLSGEPTRLEMDDLAGAPAELPDRRELLTVRVEWRPAAPVMVRDGEEGAYVGTLPLTTRVSGDTVALALTGSSLKGALRSHAEFIERTARAIDAPRASVNAPAREHSTAFLEQLDQLPAVKALFGAARTSPNPDDEYALGAGALIAEECVSRTRLPADLWDLVLQGPPDDDQAASEKTSGEERWTPRSDEGGRRPPPMPVAVRERLSALGLDQADHVAIDRWTGGAADKLLFSVLEPHDVEWEPIRLTVDLTRLGPDRDVALALLLLLVLRDLRHGRIPLGGMVNRGFGDIEVGSITLTGGAWPDGASLDDVLQTPGETRDALEEAWWTYLESAR
ncbi:RAMP superfamily CRISPR-associated protein [Thermomonospora amylolytica]|uniref:RAMP superfamily CRISPR-associated protein n=1 Tax=Thermomonospora amylolytica TaxID=1411117 RepID=UPI001F3925B6|nr:RAMP superfamily CRISPR-associated protein [Thermomonospora amylolytica]